MTLDEIKAAVDAGQTVHWVNTGYVVHKDRLGQYLITYVPNGSCIGLTDRGGHRLNGKEAEFFIGCCHVNLSAIGEGIALVGSGDVRSRFPDIKCLQPMEADG